VSPCIRGAVLIGCALAFCLTAMAQTFPSRAIRVIIPFTPGGTIDPVMRHIAQELARSIGQPIVIENKPGACTVVGVDAGAKARADGYTLVVVANSFAVNHTLVSRLPYDTLKDLRPVGLMFRTPNVLVGRADLPAKDLRELIAYAQANPGKLSYASPGNGTIQHLMGEALKVVTRSNILHVPYKGTAMNDLLGGQVDLMVGNLPTVLPHVRGGRIRAFGVSTLARAAVAPDLPTIAEQGYPEFETSAWFGLVAPAAVPEPVIARLNVELVRALSSAEVLKPLLTQGVDPIPGTPEEFGAFIRSEIAKYADVIRASRIKLE
jgi:tripartite-type tricarboxylate transporter receptor subunit TctC